MNDTPVTVCGNIPSDVELRFLPSGAAAATVSVASTPRNFDNKTQEWRDGDPLYLRLNLWRELAENAAESLSKGSRVVVTGRLKQRPWQDREGGKRQSYEIDVEDIGPSLRFATAKVKKASRDGGRPAAADPWGNEPPPF